ncbi:bifunctional adenosylcobinamide kinase/adenosylcobinamide-phosphate guanylyltransferase [Peptostreptococcaceae bacterium AGR-M142]
MSKITLVTGGARSGKSFFAENICEVKSKKISYIATAIPFDDGMKDRIKKHKQQRSKNWNTFEIKMDIYKELDKIINVSDVVLLDCITVLVNNIIFYENLDFESITYEEIDILESKVKNEFENMIKIIKKSEIDFVFVTNEIGLGIVPENKLSRIYRDIVGRINQYIAKNSDEVYFVISGIPNKIKG